MNGAKNIFFQAKADGVNKVSLCFLHPVKGIRQLDVPTAEFNDDNALRRTLSSVDLTDFGPVSQSFLVPEFDTYRTIWTPDNNNQNAVVFCDVANEKKATFCPRILLKENLENLRNNGFGDLMLGLEYEYIQYPKSSFMAVIMNIIHLCATTGDYIEMMLTNYLASVDGKKQFSEFVVSTREELARCLELSGVGVARQYQEWFYQPEIATKKKNALETCDDFFIVKKIFQDYCTKHKIPTTFIPHLNHELLTTGMHFNMSLEKSGTNLFTFNNIQLCDNFEKAIADSSCGLRFLACTKDSSLKRIRRRGSFSPGHKEGFFDKESRVEWKDPDALIDSPHLLASAISCVTLRRMRGNFVMPDPLVLWKSKQERITHKKSAQSFMDDENIQASFVSAPQLPQYLVDERLNR